MTPILEIIGLVIIFTTMLVFVWNFAEYLDRLFRKLFKNR